MDALRARHKQEQRDLVARVTAMKKQALKKTRRLVNSQCAQMEMDLQAQHQREVAELAGDADDVLPEMLLLAIDAPAPESAPESAPQSTPSAPAGDQTAPKKRNRAKERLAKRQAEVDAVRAQAQAEAADAVDYRAIEQESMAQLLRTQNLELKEIQPDGHCLFRSLQDQLQVRHDIEVSVEALRKQAADYIRAHPDDFVPYLFDEQTMALRDIGEYTAELESTAMWGLDMEIMALAQVYGCPVRVLVAGSAPLTFNEAAEAPRLTVAFYKHSYGLGEHYNLCR